LLVQVNTNEETENVDDIDEAIGKIIIIELAMTL
jgi:hypothetical protein